MENNIKNLNTLLKERNVDMSIAQKKVVLEYAKECSASKVSVESAAKTQVKPKLKPFNLEEALNGAPVITRDGRKVTHLHYFKDATSNPFKLFAVIENGLHAFKDDGSYGSFFTNENEKDLFMEQPIAECWVNVYYWENRVFTSRSFSTKEEALANISNPDTHIRTVKIDNQ